MASVQELKGRLLKKIITEALPACTITDKNSTDFIINHQGQPICDVHTWPDFSMRIRQKKHGWMEYPTWPLMNQNHPDKAAMEIIEELSYQLGSEAFF